MTADAENGALTMQALTMHEKECALAAIGALLEKATSTRERRELRIWLKAIIDAPLEDERP